MRAPISVVVVVVETDLANGDDVLITDACLYALREIVGPAFRFVRVDSLRAPYCSVFARDVSYLIKVVSGYRYGDDALNTYLKRRLQC